MNRRLRGEGGLCDGDYGCTMNFSTAIAPNGVPAPGTLALSFLLQSGHLCVY